MVHQHFMLVNQFTVLENIVMGNEAGRFFTDEAGNRGRVEELVERFGFRIDLNEGGESVRGYETAGGDSENAVQGRGHHYSGRAHSRADAPRRWMSCFESCFSSRRAARPLCSSPTS